MKSLSALRHVGAGAVVLALSFGGAGSLDAQTPLVDLAAFGAERIAAVANTPAGGVVKVRVTIANVSTVDVPPTAASAPAWSVQVTGLATPSGAAAPGGSSSVTQDFRTPLKAGQKQVFVVSLPLPCGAFTFIRVVVDPANRITEANETNNRANYQIEGNRCQ